MENKNKIKVFEMFSGYGGASFALKKANIDFEAVGFSEIDKYAVQCYKQNHKGINFGDCTKIDPLDLPDFDLLTGGFPCQAFSNAGKGLGELDTRGTLFNEIIRIAAAKKPKYMLLENVKGLTTKKHKATFDKILSELEKIGYYVQVKVLNSKNHGIPQNRERVWFVCFRESFEYVKDIFYFPEPEELKIFLKDILEDEVEDKYFLKEEYLDRLIIPDASYCIDANYAKGTNIKGYLTKKRRQIVQVKNATKKGYLEAAPGDGISLEHPDSKTRRGRVQEGISPTLQCNDSKGVIVKSNKFVRSMEYGQKAVNETIDNNELIIGEPKALDIYNKSVRDKITPTLPEPHHNSLRLFDGLRIRKLTPKECFRLMGFLDDEINLEGLSNTQRYKLAGNGWDINIVSKIFRQMFINFD